MPQHAQTNSLGKATEDRRVPLFVTDSRVRRFFTSPTKTVSKYVSRGSSVADLGCGPGFYTIPMAALAGPTGKVYAVDFDSRAIDRVAKKAAKGNLDGVIDARVGSASDLGHIPDRTVDFVFANGLLCCMKDHSGALTQIRRILKDGGLAYLSINRLGRRRDPRTVTAGEWETMLEGFSVRSSGKGLFTRWAVVSRAESPIQGGLGIPAAPEGGPACCCT